MTDEAYREFAKDGVTRFSRRPIDEAGLGRRSPTRCSSSPPRSTASRVWRRSARGSTSSSTSAACRASASTTSRCPRRCSCRPSSSCSARASSPAATVRRRASSSRSRSARDLHSACAINDAIAEVFDERQIYRIDHYLGQGDRPEHPGAALRQQHLRAAVQPEVRRPRADHRGGGRRRRHPRRLLRAGGRAARHGAEPHAAAAVAGRDGAAALARRRRHPRREARDSAVAAAAAGRRDRRQRGARASTTATCTEKPGSTPQSRTETFVALQVFVDNWRWAGVPFFLRTGKRLPKRASEISIQLKEVPPILFNADPAKRLEPNVLRSAFSRTRGSRSASAASARARTSTSRR